MNDTTYVGEPVTTRLKIIAGDEANITVPEEENVSTPNTGAASIGDIGLIFGGIIALAIVMMTILSRIRRKRGLQLSKHTPIITLFVILGVAAPISAAKAANNVTLNVASKGEVTIDLNDFEAGQIAYVKDTVTIANAINSPIVIYLTASSNKLVDSNNATVAQSIQAAGDLTNNTLGYTAATTVSESTSWSPLPTAKTSIIEAHSNAANKTYDIYYGIKPKDLAAGTYTIDFTYEVEVLNSEGLTDISSMQQITPQIVAATPTDTVHKLVDDRDGKVYAVAKMADGHIWMTQNLDYDIQPSRNIISNNDGTTSTWSPGTPTYDGMPFNDQTNFGTFSYDPGNYAMLDGYGEVVEKYCDEYDFDSDCVYHVGNLYQWNAATAGTGGVLTSQDAPSSICPKGWRLPSSNSYTDDHSFGKFLNAMGITNNDNAANDEAILQAPFYFVRGGAVYAGGSFSSYNECGRYWSSTAASDAAHAYALGFDDTFVDPSRSSYRYRGFSVRCVSI